MSRQYVFLFVLALLVVGIGAYKVGDHYGFEAGQKYGYGLDCREDLEKLKDVMNHMRISLEYAQGSLKNFSNSRAAAIDLVAARRYNATRDSMLKKNPDDVMLRAIVSYDDNGYPVYDEEYLRCLAGLRPCK